MWSLSACAESMAAPDTDPLPDLASAPVETPRPADTTFEDVLAEYQSLNQRLVRVAAPLRLQNTSLCNTTVRDPGFATHTLNDYPARLRPMAKAMLGLGDTGVFIRSVRPQTSAAEQKLAAGDQVLAVNENPISGDAMMDTYNEAILKKGFDSVLSKVKIRTPDGTEYLARIRPNTACDIPAKVVFSEDINGHTDGQEILITSALMRSVPDDTNLALVIAHEMGRSHPSTRARYENFRNELDRIQSVENLEALGF